MADQHRSRFPAVLRLRLPEGVNEALDALANQRRQTRSEVVRQVLLRELEARGVLPTPTVQP
jgi:predicted transcriptional regulator